MDDFYLAQKIAGFFLLGIKNCYTFCRVQGGRDPSKLLFSVSLLFVQTISTKNSYEIHRGKSLFFWSTKGLVEDFHPKLKHFGNKHAIFLSAFNQTKSGVVSATPFLGYHCCGGVDVRRFCGSCPEKRWVAKDTQEVNAASSWHGTGDKRSNWT